MDRGRGDPTVPRIPTGARRATVLLIALRIAYAYNWFDLGPGLPALSVEFHATPVQWGALLAAFLAGAGLLQVPAGLLARRRGTRWVALAGAGLFGAAAVASAGAPTLDALLVLRFLAGAGAGLFFSPAIALVAALQPEGRRGVPVGLFSSAFSVGAGLGLVGSAVLIGPIGWRGALLVGGLLLLALFLASLLGIPRAADPAPGPSSERFTWPEALRSRAVWAIGFAFIGLEGTTLSAGQYFVPYAESIRGWSAAMAGTIAALFVFPSFFGGPVGGRWAERFTNRRAQLLVATAVPGVLIGLVPWVGLALVIPLALAFSIGYGMVYAMMYVAAAYLPGIPRGEVPLAIGLFNGLQITGGAGVAQLIGVVIARYGYPAGWAAMAIATVGFLPLLSWVPPIVPGRPSIRTESSSPSPPSAPVGPK